MAREGAASRRASNALKVAFQPFDVDFHPTAHLLSVSFISGVVQLLNVDPTTLQFESKWKKRGHTDSCRAARFAANGRCECWLLGVCGAAGGVWCAAGGVWCAAGGVWCAAGGVWCAAGGVWCCWGCVVLGLVQLRLVVSAAADKSIVVRDTETGERVSKVMGAHSEGINRLACWDDSCVASGDDSGTVKASHPSPPLSTSALACMLLLQLWDLRQDGGAAGSIATVQGASAYLTSIASGPSCPLQDGGAVGSTAAVHVASDYLTHIRPFPSYVTLLKLWDLRQDGSAVGSTATVQMASQDGSAVGSTATLWDLRQDGGAVGSTATVQVASDYLTDIRPLPACNRLLAASGDGSMAVVDLATNRLTAHTDSTDDDLLSIVAVKAAAVLTGRSPSLTLFLICLASPPLSPVNPISPTSERFQGGVWLSERVALPHSFLSLSPPLHCLPLPSSIPCTPQSDSKVVCGSQSGLLYFFNMNGAERDNAVPHCSQPASRPCALRPLPASYAPMPSFSLILRPHMLSQLDDKALLAACLSSMRSTPTSCLTCCAPMPSLSLGLGHTCSPSWTTRRCLQPAPMDSSNSPPAVHALFSPLLPHMLCSHALILPRPRPHMLSQLDDNTLLAACSHGLFQAVSCPLALLPHALPSPYALIPHQLDDDTLLTACSDGLIRVVSVFPNRFLDVVGSHTDAAVEALGEWVGGCGGGRVGEWWFRGCVDGAMPFPR
ncbi:unnamed protein product [Closterium sp. NIES-65]|nr:unnamed protein product [Closterium sp. NIES-65]